MREADLAPIDLNLLVALHALLTERHVTRAARRVRMSQPAMSRALGRLRELFSDDLLARVGRQMRPTPRAEELLWTRGAARLCCPLWHAHQPGARVILG